MQPDRPMRVGRDSNLGCLLNGTAGPTYWGVRVSVGVSMYSVPFSSLLNCALPRAGVSVSGNYLFFALAVLRSKLQVSWARDLPLVE